MYLLFFGKFLGTNKIPIKRCIRLSNDSETDYEDEEIEDDEDDSCFILDARHYGSISRFYNHSCKPNVHIQNVIIIKFIVHKRNFIISIFF